MRSFARPLACLVPCVLVCLFVVYTAASLTVERISLERMTAESRLVVHGTVLSSHSQREGGNINTYSTIRIRESLKGNSVGTLTVKQFGGRIGDLAEEIPGSPELRKSEEVVLFLVQWQGHYWIHSIVLGKFTVMEQDGMRVAFNDLQNVGLIDPVTKREVVDPSQKSSAFPLDSFLSEIRSLSAK